jgi:hypothetical protein
MASRKQVIVADHERLQFTRWVLFVLVANEAAGLPPVSRHRLHALLFMSFASSSYYGIAPLRQRARRTEHGPYYRWAHIALGGLVLSGLVSLRDFQAHPKPRDLQFEGVFQPTLAGLKVARVLRKTGSGKALYQFILDLCLASARTVEDEPGTQIHKVPDTQMQARVLDQVLEEDLTYQQVVHWHSDTLDHQPATEEATPTVTGLTAIDSHLERAGRLNRKDILAAYQSVLLQRARRSAA